MLEITLKKGLIGKPASQRRIVAALGLHKYGSSVKHYASPTIKGMIKKIEHLVAVSECKEISTKTKSHAKAGATKKVEGEDN